MEASECGASLIARKDSIHRHWFNLQSYPNNIKQPDSTLLRKDKTERLLDLAKRAASQAHQCSEDNPESETSVSVLDWLDGSIARLERKLEASEPTDYAGITYYELPPPVATAILIEDINEIANAVHKLGYSFLERVGSYCGCTLYEGNDLKSVNRGALSYCEGIPGREHGNLLQGGTKVEHQLGVHKNVIDFEEELDGYGLKLVYTESGQGNWDDRQAGMVEHFQDKFGMDCKTEGTIASCRGIVKDEDLIRELAYFSGSVRDIDILHSDCIPACMDWVRDEAASAVKEKGAESYNRPPYPNTSSEWKEEICEPVEEVEEEERRRDPLDRDIEALRAKRDFADSWRKDSKYHLCNLSPYYAMRNAINTVKDIEETCDDVQRHGGNKWACLEEMREEEEANKRAAQELVRRCPPVPIINQVETDPTFVPSFDMNPFEAVCGIIGAEECLAEVKRATARYQEHTKVKALF